VLVDLNLVTSPFVTTQFVAIGWFRDAVTNLPQYTLQQISVISDPFSSAGNILSDISLETQRACDEVFICLA
jgi:hypothetical protein